MLSQYALLATLAFATLATAVKPLTPTTGWLVDYGDNPRYIFPLAATECEPFYIFYNTTADGYAFSFSIRDAPHDIFNIDIPKGIGYVEWICNIPAGIAFRVNAPLDYVVQPGSSSACLGDLTTTYSRLDYITTEFASFTRTASHTTTVVDTSVMYMPVASFPTGAFPTILLNPNLAIAPTSSPPLSPFSTPTKSLSSPTMSSSPTPSPDSRRLSVIGGVVGVVAVIPFVLIFVLWRKRTRSVPARAYSPFDPQAANDSGMPTYLSPLFQVSDAEHLGTNPATNVAPASKSSPFATLSAFQRPPEKGPEASQHAPSLAGRRPSQGTITPLDAEPVLHKPRNAWARKPSAPHLAPHLAPRALPAAGQLPYTQPSDAPAIAATETSLPDPLPLFQQSPMSATQKGPFNLAAVLGVVSRARLSARERQVVSNLLMQPLSKSPDLARQNVTSSPPPYVA